MRGALVLLLLAASAAAGLEERLYVVLVTTERASAGGPVRQTLAAPALPVGPKGLFMAVGFALDPPGPEERRAVHVRLRAPDGRRVEARILRGERDLDCTFFRAQGEAPPPVPLRSQPLRPGDSVLLLSRHGARFGYALRRTRVRIEAAVDEPQRLYALEGAPRSFLGAVAVFPSTGALLGFVDARSTMGETDGAMLGVGTRTIVLVAAEAYAPAAEQAGRARAPRAWLGVNLAPFTRDREAYFGIEQDWRGALVTGVAPGSPAEKAGLRVHDLLQSIGPLRLRFEAQSEWDTMLRAVQRLPLGVPLACKVVRFAPRPDGGFDPRPLELTLVLTERPLDFEDAPESEVPGLGFRVKPLTLDWRRAERIPDGVEGVVVSALARASPAQLAGLRPRDLILSLDGEATPAPEVLLRLVARAREGRRAKLVFFVRRGAETRFVALETGW